MKKKKDFDKSLLILLAIILITVVTAFSLYLNVRVDKVTQVIKDKGVLSVLLTVEDRNELILSQVLIINSDTNKGAIVDIPENTGTIISSQKKFSSVESIYIDEGPEEYRKKISQILALDIPFHIIMSKDGFSNLVDFFDGLEIFISKSLEESSTSFNIPAGSVVLEGDKALQYLNLDIGEDFDSGLVSRRQKIMQAFLSQIKEYSSKIVLENNLPYILDKISSNLDISSSKTLFELLGSLQVDRLVLQSIIGEKKTVSGQELIFPYNSENLIKVRIKRILINLSNPEVISDEQLNFNIEVLNGTHTPGLASRTAKYFSSFGYNVSSFGNADKSNNEYEYTTILVRKGNLEAAERIGELINCEYIHSQVEEGIDDTIDFTIILGKDFDGKRVRN